PIHTNTPSEDRQMKLLGRGGKNETRRESTSQNSEPKDEEASDIIERIHTGIEMWLSQREELTRRIARLEESSQMDNSKEELIRMRMQLESMERELQFLKRANRNLQKKLLNTALHANKMNHRPQAQGADSLEIMEDEFAHNSGNFAVAINKFIAEIPGNTPLTNFGETQEKISDLIAENSKLRVELTTVRRRFSAALKESDDNDSDDTHSDKKYSQDCLSTLSQQLLIIGDLLKTSHRKMIDTSLSNGERTPSKESLDKLENALITMETSLSSLSLAGPSASEMMADLLMAMMVNDEDA
ncbi:hypothetical protein PFISCL1PPCAC_19272, partial [Pristionchus fissidentatus]